MSSLRRRLTSESNGNHNFNDFEGIRTVDFSNYTFQHFEESPVVIMPRDRTNEFASAVQSLQGRQIMRAVTSKDAKKAKTLQNYAELMLVARSIGKNLASTYSKLEKLTLLVKRKPLFDDKPMEIQELSYIIKEDLKGINEQLARLQNISNLNQKHQNNFHSHSNNMVISLQYKLCSMSNEFKSVLDTRTENLKQAKDRRDQFSDSNIGVSGPAVPEKRNTYQSDLLIFEDEAASSNFRNSTFVANRGQQQQQRMLVFPDQTNQYLESRADTMQNIESTIVELGGIFQQLAHMVNEQSEMVERIDSNFAEAELNVEAAHHQILRYFRSVSSNRWLMIKVFAILIFFFAFFLIFLA